MGNSEVNDDHATDLSRVREVHDVVDHLRRLFAAAFQASEGAGGASWVSDPGRPAGSQPPVGR